jgi:hypothetical protein
MLNFLRLVCNIAERIMYAVLILMVVLILLSTLQGCSVNVIVAPHATLGVSSDLSQQAVQELERRYE